MKYIVYLTTNLINKNIYVGVHGTESITKFDGYLGCGVNRYNPSSILHPKTPFQHAVKKYGFDSFYRTTLKIFDTSQEALDFEQEIVDLDFINRKDTYNITVGGSKPPRHDIKCYQYDLNGNFLKEWESITQAALNYSNCVGGNIFTAIQFNKTSYNSLWTTYKVDKLNLENFHVYSPKTPVYLYTNDMKFYKSFDSMSQVSKYLNSSLSHIQRAIKTFTKVSEYYISDKLYDILPVNKTRLSGLVHQYNVSGEYIRSYNSIKEAEDILGINLPGINTSIKLDQVYKGFIWRRGEKLESVPSKITSEIKAKKVGQYTIDGQLVKIFNTVREARKEFPNVSKVLSGVARHCHNFIFKYIE